MNHAFEIRSFPKGSGRPQFFLIQYPLSTRLLEAVQAPTTVAQIDGSSTDFIQETLRSLVPHAPHDLLEGKTGSAPLEEDAAVRLGIIFAAINSLRSEERIRQIIDGTLELPEERAVAWFGMITGDETGNAVSAFRVYITGDK